MSRPDVAERFRRAAALLDRLERLLGEESAALRARDTDVLHAAVAQKRRLLVEIREAMPEALLANGPAAARGELIEGLRRCRALNETSGAVIAALRHDTQHALGLLGIDRDAPAYGYSGRASFSAAGRALAVG